MTKKLYDLDAYATEFDAKVLSCEAVAEGEKTVYKTILDETLFFPEEGGQSPDKGMLGGAEVLDVRIEQDTIIHTLSKPLATGENVHGKICWEHRFSNMQQHSGEHIFSGIVNRLYGFSNVGFHLSDNIVTMDFDGVLTEEDVRKVETLANEAIAKNLPVTVSYPSEEELALLKYRSKIEIKGQVRIVTIKDVDVCACCAPHVRYTGEIGLLKIMSVQNYKGGVRLSMLCGFRALEAFREKAAVINSLTEFLTVSQELLPDRVKKLKADMQDYKYRLAQAKQRLLELKIEGIPAEQEHVVLFEQEMENIVMRNAVNKMTAVHSGFCGIFAGTEENGYRFIIGSAASDCMKAAAALRDAAKAKCGGSRQMIQGTVNAPETLLRELVEHIS